MLSNIIESIKNVVKDLPIVICNPFALVYFGDTNKSTNFCDSCFRKSPFIKYLIVFANWVPKKKV